MSNFARHTIHPGIAGLILGLILLHGCRDESDHPFQIDTDSGVFSFMEGRGRMVPAHMDLNGSNPLKNSFLFREKDSLVYINSVGDLDIIMLFAGDTTEGMLQLQLINAGKENLEIFKLDPLVLPLTLGDRVSLINGREASVVCTGGQSTHFILSVAEGTPWDLHFSESAESLILSLLFNGSSVVLLPEENLRLPAIRINARLPQDPN